MEIPMRLRHQDASFAQLVQGIDLGAVTDELEREKLGATLASRSTSACSAGSTHSANELPQPACVQGIQATVDDLVFQCNQFLDLVEEPGINE